MTTRWTRPGLAILALMIAAAPLEAQAVQPLSLRDAEARALQNHPQIRAGEYAVQDAQETVREVKSVKLPTVWGNVTGVDALSGSAITTGGLNNSTVLDRFAYGVAGSQLLTDFGRTGDLTAAATLRVEAQQQDVELRRATVLLGVDRAYFEGLRAQAVLHVAEQTVAARQLVVDQVTALESAGLRSTLDLGFAKVNLSEAQLLLLQAASDVQASYAGLSAAMGTPQRATYTLSDTVLPGAPTADSAGLIAQALRDRPDLVRERLAQQSLVTFAKAERSLWTPTVALVGGAGLTPYHQAGLTDRYSAIGVNVTVPLTNGNLYAARAAQANFRASAAQQTVLDLENRITRDVEVAWLDAQSAYQRLDLTNQLLAQATDTLDLAQQRYNIGLSSIVELTQAQLNETRAQLAQAAARFEYQSLDAALRFQIGALK